MNRAWKHCLHWLPEIGIAAAALYFFLRELDSFPSPWQDEGLFLIFAKEIAAGKGYGMPILDGRWEFPVYPFSPFFFSVVALPIRLFGFSVTAARAPMVLFLIGSTVLLYRFTERIGGRGNARWATALLVSLSAFVNTGKPVLGEIPGFFFHLSSLLLLLRILEGNEKGWKLLAWSFLSGFLFGIPAGLKITNVILLSCIALSGLWALVARRRREVMIAFAMLIAAAIPFSAWKVLEFLHSRDEFITWYDNYLHWRGFNVPDHGVTFELLLRVPYLAFGVILALGTMGLWSLRRKLHPFISIIIASSVLLFIAYFLGREGWYRHLLPAHLLLLPFVPAGAFYILGKRLGAFLLASIVLLQGYWQLTYRGSPRGPRGEAAAAYIEERLRDRDLIVQQAEVYMRLSENPRWRFLLPSVPLSILLPHVTLSPQERCMPMVRTLSGEEQETYEGRITKLEGKIFLLEPPKECESS